MKNNNFLKSFNNLMYKVKGNNEILLGQNEILNVFLKNSNVVKDLSYLIIYKK